MGKNRIVDKTGGLSGGGWRGTATDIANNALRHKNRGVKEMNWGAIIDTLELLRVERNAEVVRNEEAGRTIVRFGMLVFVLVFVHDSGKGNGYQIITDTHRNHAAGKIDVDSIVPQCRLPFQKCAVSELGVLF